MEITKFRHACIRVRSGSTTVVIDPGGFTEDEAVEGADAILVTHEHADHFSPERLHAALEADPAVTIWTNSAVAGRLDGPSARVRVVGDGDSMRLGDVEVEVHGEIHEEIHPDIPRVGNIGFLLGENVFHPGDAFTDPGRPVDTLMLPVHAPWSKTGQVIDYVRSLQPRQALSVHDALLSGIGLSVVGNLLGTNGPGVGTSTYRYLKPGDTTEVS